MDRLRDVLERVTRGALAPHDAARLLRGMPAGAEEPAARPTRSGATLRDATTTAEAMPRRNGTAETGAGEGTVPGAGVAPATGHGAFEGAGRDDAARDYVLQALADVFQMPRDRLRLDASFGSLGIDSRGFVELLKQLQADLGPLPKTLLFEYPTAARLAAHLAERHGEALARRSDAAPAVAKEGLPPVRTRSDASEGAVANEAPLASSNAGTRAEDVKRAGPMRVAIVGLVGRFPMADDLDTFWANLAAGRNCVTEVPPDRWEADAHFDPEPGAPGKACGKWGGFLTRVDTFDYRYFGISPREAAYMAPEERLMLETTATLFEQAGYTRRRLADEQRQGAGVGVFVGCMHQHYRDLAERPEDVALLSTTSYWGIANRLSYTFDLRGPSLAIDTACASALTAMHAACESLRRGECRMAIAGAVNLSLHPAKYVSLSQIGMLSTGAESRGLGMADGLVPGEGVGALLLKPLEAALADGDPIQAVILSSAASHGGAAGSYTAVNPEALARVIESAVRAAEIDPRTITYLELAANGSPMGDALELTATNAALARLDVAASCAIGTVKSNIGHLEAASGLSQIAKVVLQMTHGQLAPSIHCDPENPDLPLGGSPCRIQRDLSAWEPVTLDGARMPRRAGITSVGAGGSYAHLVLEEHTPLAAATAATAAVMAPDSARNGIVEPAAEDGPQLLTLSAKTAERLGVMTARLATWLRDHPDVQLCDVAFTLQTRRDAFDERLAVVASTVGEAWQQLERASREGASTTDRREAKGTAGEAKAGGVTRGSVSTDTTSPAALREKVARGQWHELARLWMAGAELPWEEIHPHGSRRILPLPTYPFEPTRAWITDRRETAPPVAAAPTPSLTALSMAPSTTTDAADTRIRLFEPTRARVAELASAVLDVDASDLGDGQGFVQHGMTSVGAVLLVRSINRTFGLTLKTTALFECATVPDLARLIVERSPVVAAAAPAVLTEPRVPGPSSVSNAPNTLNLTTPAVAGASDAFETPDLQHHYAVTVAEPQLLSDLRLRRIEPRAPEKGEVQIDVRAFALNFGDLLCVQGLYPTMPEYPFTPGFEVAGVVSGIGEGVTRIGVGDEVMALTGAGLGGHATVATVPEWLVVRKPAGVPYEEAAAFPVAYLTMRHAFDVAQVQPGERVLIQTAAGGLGLIALQMARQIGAEVIATAGSPRKLDYLRARGVAHVINYREEDFAARTRELVGPQGVDVVFNTLAGDAIQKGLELLGPGGRYVEIAMTGLQTSGRVDLSCLSSNQSLHCVDMRRLGGSRPELLRAYLERMAAALAEGDVRPTIDRLFDLSQVREAYAHIADAQNIGKVVVSVPPRVAAGVPARVPERAIVPASRTRRDEREPIAVIGMSGRFPGADDVGTFWQMLREGRSAIRDVPPERWDWRAFYRTERGTRGGIYTRQGGFLTDIDRFDAHFFRMSGREAAFTDPQQRLFLEECWKALDDAGMARLATRGARTGVFAGAASGDYQLRLAAVDPEPQAFWGNSASLIPARINYFLNLTGPSVSVDTACSSSLVAVHLACQALRSGECDVALAGGVYVGTTPGLFLAGCSASMLSPDGRCKAFDDAADGFVAGEGVAAIVLKPLAAAERDRDQIHAVLLATGTNQDGRTYGITVPSARAQAELESSVYEQAGVDPRSIGMVEAHGTGTRLGDPVEVDALTEAFRRSTPDRQFCALGSVKTNIGHAAAAAGIAGLIKAVLALKHGEIPASLHFDQPNAQTPFESTPFFVNTALRPWRRDQGPRRAAVSSFGFSGTNAHVLLEEYRSPAAAPDVERPVLVPLSARDDRALMEMARRLAASLRSGDRRLADVAWTLQRGREAMDERLALVARSTDDLAAQLERAASGELPPAARGARGRATRELAEGARAAADADVHALLQQDAAGAETLERLAALWVRGAAIDWTMLPAPADARTVSLPAYPFARERHWIDAPSVSPAIVPAAAPAVTSAVTPVVALSGTSAVTSVVSSVASAVVTPAGDAERSLVTLRTVWRPSTLPRSRAGADDAAPPFVLIDGRRGRDGRDPLAALASAAPDVRAAIVIWPEALDTGRLDAEPFSEAIVHGMGLAARVLQAIAARGADRPFRLIFVAREEGGLVDPFVEAVSAFVPSLRQVMPRLAATFVSVDAGAATGAAADDAATRTLIDCATAELRATGRADRVRYHSGTRLVAGLERMASQSDADPQIGCPLKMGGVYVISGGLGRLGRQLGRHLATTANARVMLLGRPRSGVSRAGEVGSLRESGTALETVAADVTRADDVAAALEAVRRRHGRIDGVFHLAGCAGSVPLMEKGTADIEATVAAKMAGALHLDRLTRSDALDFFALFSSSSAWLGDFGRGDYAASNRFLDAYAAVREAARHGGRCQGRTVSLGWSMWRDGGMHGDADAAELFMKTSGFRYIELGEGLFVLERLLARGEAHALVVSATPARIDALVAPPATTEEPTIDASVDASAYARSGASLATLDTSLAGGVASTTSAAPSHVAAAATAPDDGVVLRALLEEDLRTVVGTLLQLDASRLDLDDNLGNFGFDSLTLAELADDLSTRYAIQLSPQLFYSATTLRRVASHLLEKQPDEVRARLPLSPAATAVSNALVSGAAVDVPAAAAPTAAVPAVDAPAADGDPQAVAPPSAERPAGAAASERVAVIGMAGLLPGSRGVREFWRHLEAGDDLITRREGQWGGFIPDADRFDAAFFSISPREAELMDPQQRLLLQVVQGLFEDAGCPVASVAGRRVGVFVGVEQSDYAQRLWRAGLSHEVHATVGTHPAFMPNRVSHVFDLHGPSEVINAGCASGTLAVHRAIASMARGECEMAVVAATNLLLSTDGYDVVSRFNTLSPSGTVQAFAKGATGSARAEGVCAVLLAPLDEARAAGRRVHAVIAGAAATHGGRGQSVAAPNPAAQAESIRRACASAGVEPRSLGYLEAQATGSELGDAIELGGYQEALGLPAAGAPRCALGALKPSCGHLEAASGIAALIKVSLALQHRTIPAVKHADSGAALEAIAEGGFYLPSRSLPWEAMRDAAGQPLPRRAGIQSYGLGGVYVHLVVEEAPALRFDTAISASEPDVPQLIVLSARDEERLAERVSDLAAFLDGASEAIDGSSDERPGSGLADIAFTLQVGRDSMRARLALLAGSRDELRARLASILRGNADAPGIYRGGGELPAITPSTSRPLPPGDAPRDARIAAAIRTRDLETLATLWIAGASVPWSELHGAHRPRIVSLPTYPFARERHWVDDAPPPAATPITAAPQGGSDEPTTLDWLRDVVADRLKVDSSRLAVDTPFVQYGLDSLLSTQVMQLIQMRHGRTIPYAAMTEHPTLLRLAAHLDAVSGATRADQRPRAAATATAATPEAASASPAASTTRSPSTSTSPRGRTGRYAADDAMQSLLLINPTGRHAPSFWVHGAPGTGELYNHLSAALGPEYPIYAFQARGIDGMTLPFTTLPEMAAHYVDAMLAVQPAGPYFIGGYSSGGLIAYEIAQQLTLRGLDVGHLILLDTYPPEMLKSFGRTRSRRKRHLQRVMGAILFFAAENRIDIWDRLSVEDLKAIPDTAPIAHLARLVKQRLSTPLPEDHVFRVLSGVDTILALNDEMGRGYELRPYAGSDVLFFKTRELIDPKSPYGIPGLDIADLGFKKDTFARIADFPYLDMWRALIARRVDVVPCACDHLSLFDEPHVDIVRQKLASAFAPYSLHATHGKVVTP